jgi:hypothetical protein
MNKKSEALLDLVHDSLAILDVWGTERAHEPIGACRKSRMNHYLTLLHAPLTKAGIRKPTDQQRHYIFSRLFDREIKSAKEITIAEVVTWSNIGRTHSASAEVLLTDLLNESDGH